MCRTVQRSSRKTNPISAMGSRNGKIHPLTRCSIRYFRMYPYIRESYHTFTKSAIEHNGLLRKLRLYLGLWNRSDYETELQTKRRYLLPVQIKYTTVVKRRIFCRFCAMIHVIQDKPTITRLHHLMDAVSRTRAQTLSAIFVKWIETKPSFSPIMSPNTARLQFQFFFVFNFSIQRICQSQSMRHNTQSIVRDCWLCAKGCNHETKKSTSN